MLPMKKPQMAFAGMLALLTSVPLKAPALPSGAVSSAKTVAVTVTV